MNTDTFLRSFFSQHILKGFDPTGVDWREALRSIPSDAQEEPEDDEEVLARIRVLLRSATARDNMHGFPGATIGELDALFDLKDQSGRCAVTANKLTCVPKKLNSFRPPGHFGVRQLAPGQYPARRH